MNEAIPSSLKLLSLQQYKCDNGLQRNSLMKSWKKFLWHKRETTKYFYRC